MEYKLNQTTSNKREVSQDEKQKRYNQLINEKSPYLLQHANNPVNWYPWGEKAFKRARNENKPIFLSIGYSTCHWCHVMAHESFEDPEIARMMNDTFISVKVDREERPDIDSVYMEVCMRLTGAGGWPLTIIMTPDKKPFFAGTYFPKEERFGRIGIKELIFSIKKQWEIRKEELHQTAEEITSILQQRLDNTHESELDDVILKVAFEELAQRYDSSYGGFGRAPKFPTPHNLFFLLRYWKRNCNKKALKMIEKTLQNMRQGGIYDHLGYGFHRYSTDHQWLVPHFEKMLYDQALISIAYLEAYQATGKELYAKVAQEIFDYVLRDMADPLGGFHSAEDADSEGEEGKFYVWTEKELNEILGEEAGIAIEIFNIKENGNYLEEATREKTGKNILHLNKPLKKLTTELNISEKDLRTKIESIRQKLFLVREKRVHPHKDDKILTDWNGLMIAALAKGGGILNEMKYIEAAKQAVNFILTNMRSSEGKLLHRYREGEADIPAYLDDYAFLIWGLLELYEASFDVQYLRNALSLNKSLLKHFWDNEGGGFYFVADNSEKLLVRKKEIYDGAIPSGNAVAMLNLLRLGRLTGNTNLEEKAVEIGRAFSMQINQSPAAHTYLLSTVDFTMMPTYEVVIVGQSHSDDTKEMIYTVRCAFIPNKVVIFRATDQESPDIDQLIGFSKNYDSLFDRATAYVCQNYSCKLPTTDVGKMLDLLSE